VGGRAYAEITEQWLKNRDFYPTDHDILFNFANSVICSKKKVCQDEGVIKYVNKTNKEKEGGVWPMRT
jgi:hypothetical protein